MYFITGNDNKYDEMKALLPELQRLHMHLPEIQDLDPNVIIHHKLEEALKHHVGPVLVEDTSLYLDALGGLPGPFIKWFETALGLAKMAEIVTNLGNTKTHATVRIGYAVEASDIHYFEGTISGSIVSQRGTHGFGWDTIFMPDGFTKTMAEMTFDEKQSMNMRAKAVAKLKDYLESHKA